MSSDAKEHIRDNMQSTLVLDIKAKTKGGQGEGMPCVCVCVRACVRACVRVCV